MGIGSIFYIYFKEDEGIKDLTSVQYNFFYFPLHTKTASSRENTELFVQCFINVLKHDNFMCSKIELNIEILMVF